VQSGNVVLSSAATPDQIRDRCERRIARQFGFDVDVVVRSRDEFAEVVARNPLGDVADNPKRYQVSFLSEQPAPPVVEKLASLAAPAERMVHIGREIYAWHPSGVARSKLWAALAAAGGLGVKATARNWTTVTTLLAMADER
jgi:uncharacterized protein (DUF1697 family)